VRSSPRGETVVSISGPGKVTQLLRMQHSILRGWSDENLAVHLSQNAGTAMYELCQ